MKKFLCLLTMLPLLVSAVEYEFLTPQVVVVKNSKQYKYTSHEIAKQGVWLKENALLRDKAGNIQSRPDTTFYDYIIFTQPLKAGEKVSMAGTVLQYDPTVPSNIFKLNQLGNGVGQKFKYAYMGSWLGNLGPLPLKYLAGQTFELRRSSDNQCIYRNVLKLRRDDPVYQEDILFTGEEVLVQHSRQILFLC